MGMMWRVLVGVRWGRDWDEEGGSGCEGLGGIEE